MYGLPCLLPEPLCFWKCSSKGARKLKYGELKRPGANAPGLFNSIGRWIHHSVAAVVLRTVVAVVARLLSGSFIGLSVCAASLFLTCSGNGGVRSSSHGSAAGFAFTGMHLSTRVVAGFSTCMTRSAFVDERCNHQSHDGRQLDEDVHGRTGRILEGITHGVAGNGCLVRLRSFLEGLTVNHNSFFKALFGVVPSATGVVLKKEL